MQQLYEKLLIDILYILGYSVYSRGYIFYLITPKIDNHALEKPLSALKVSIMIRPINTHEHIHIYVIHLTCKN
jgi:hypothetical protein